MNTDHSNATTKLPQTVFCPPFREIFIGTLDSSVPYFINTSLNAALAVIATLGNLLILLVMRHVSSIRLPSKLLLCSLVLTDLGAGLVVLPLNAAYVSRGFNPNFSVCPFYLSLKFSGSMLSSASLFTLTAISLDRYVALFFHLKYHQIVTTRRVCAVLAFIWLGSLFFASSSLWNFVIWSVVVIAGSVIAFPVISVAYIKIYCRLRSQQVQAPDQQTGNSPNMERYRRTASAMMWVYVVSIACYFPYLFIASVTNTGLTPLIGCIREFGYTVVLLNSCLNPLVYCLSLPEVRTLVMKQLRKFCSRGSQYSVSEG